MSQDLVSRSSTVSFYGSGGIESPCIWHRLRHSKYLDTRNIKFSKQSTFKSWKRILTHILNSSHPTSPHAQVLIWWTNKFINVANSQSQQTQKHDMIVSMVYCYSWLNGTMHVCCFQPPDTTGYHRMSLWNSLSGNTCCRPISSSVQTILFAGASLPMHLRAIRMRRESHLTASLPRKAIYGSICGVFYKGTPPHLNASHQGTTGSAAAAPTAAEESVGAEPLDRNTTVLEDPIDNRRSYSYRCVPPSLALQIHMQDSQRQAARRQLGPDDHTQNILTRQKDSGWMRDEY